MLHKKKSLVRERLRLCRCSVCVYSVKSLAFFHLRPHKQQKLEHFLGNQRPTTSSATVPVINEDLDYDLLKCF